MAAGQAESPYALVYVEATTHTAASLSRSTRICLASDRPDCIDPIRKMSSQPSTVDQLKNTTANAFSTASQKLDPSVNNKASQDKGLKTDDQGGVCKEGSFKDQLNQAARFEPAKDEPKGYIQQGPSPLRSASASLEDREIAGC